MMQRPILRSITIVGIFVVGASNAQSTSCASRHDRYVFSCDSQRCIGEFRVDEVAAFGNCSRRPVVKDIDPQVAAFLAPLVGSPVPGVYTFTLPDRYFPSNVDDGSLGALLGRMEIASGGVEWRTLSPSELPREAETHFGKEWLRKDDEHNNALEAKRAWEGKAWREHMQSASLWGAFWASFAVAVAWLVQSIHVFFLRLYQVPAQGLRHLAAPWLAQVTIGAVGVGAAFVMPFDFWPGTLLVPVVVVVLLAEGWAWFRRRYVSLQRNA